MPHSLFAEPLRQQMQHQRSGGSHDIDHLETVLRYAQSLQQTYGGDIDVLTAAVYLHDLGRTDPNLHGAASRDLSVQLATTLLAAIDFPSDKQPDVLLAISEHDQPDIRPTTLTGRILKDADFLAGFGAIGIARSALWTGESGGNMADFIDRVERKMAARIDSLEFAQSRQYATQEYHFALLFLAKLQQPQVMQPLATAPYICIEGISGSGKSTQQELLYTKFQAEGQTPFIVNEPTEWYLQQRSTVRGDRTGQLLLLLADRQLHIAPEIHMATVAGQPVIASRSYLSTMVYQAGEDWLSPANIAYLHTFLPQPTHIFIIDLPAEEALQRINTRATDKHVERGENELIDRLLLHRQRYLGLRRFFPHIVLIDGQQSTADIHQQIWQQLQMPAMGE